MRRALGFMWEYFPIRTPIGEIYLVGQSGILQKIYLPGQQPQLMDSHWEKAPEAFKEAARQITEYLSGKRREFTLPIEVRASPFQQSVYEEVAKIPYGDTLSYQEVANRLGNPKAVRAVGAANGKNPLPIVIPCHRVLGSSNQLVGYSGGLELKRYLLEFESKQLNLF